MVKLQSLFGGGSQALVGLDISSSSVKLLEMSRKGDRYHVEAYANEPLPANAVNDKQIVDSNAVAEAISKARKVAGTSTPNVAVAVSGADVITKVINMAGTYSESELEAQIKAQADQYIPYPIEEVNLDFQVLGVSEKKSDEVDVLLAACRKQQVEKRIEAITLAGLTPKVVDIEVYAMENACTFLRHQMPEQGNNKTVAVVDVGSTVTSVLILHDMKTVYTRDQQFGGKQLTEDIMRHYSMSFDEAMRAKKLGNLPENYESEVLAHFISDMAQQIDRSFQFFFSSSSKFTNIDQIILAGGCANIRGVDQSVQEKLRVPTVVAQPFAQTSVASRAKPQQLAKEAPSMLIACGLALRSFDAPK